MKISLLITYSGLFFNGTVLTQSVSEIKFEVRENSSATDKNLVSVSTSIATKQANGDGIHFTLIVKNNSGKSITINNVANRLAVTLINERGFDVAIRNNALLMIKRGDPRWKYRSETVVPGSVYINGREENGDIKAQEYIQIPANSSWKINLVLKNVVKIETSQNIQDGITKLAPGKYKLMLRLGIFSNNQHKSSSLVAGFESPLIEIDYTR